MPVQTRSKWRALCADAYKKQLENSGISWVKIDAKAEDKMAQKAKDDAYTSLWNSGCENLCYHFGFCSDIMGDCWEPVYNASGLEGLKNDLLKTSNRIHDGETCEDCKQWIDGLHD
jgi:hypothetical protein